MIDYRELQAKVALLGLEGASVSVRWTTVAWSKEAPTLVMVLLTLPLKAPFHADILDSLGLPRSNMVLGTSPVNINHYWYSTKLFAHLPTKLDRG